MADGAIDLEAHSNERSERPGVSIDRYGVDSGKPWDRKTLEHWKVVEAESERLTGIVPCSDTDEQIGVERAWLWLQGGVPELTEQQARACLTPCQQAAWDTVIWQHTMAMMAGSPEAIALPDDTCGPLCLWVCFCLILIALLFLLFWLGVQG